MACRFRSIEFVRFFFQPVVLDFETPDFLKKFFDGGIVVLFLRSTVGEDIGGLFEESCFPLGDGDRMNFELCRQLTERFFLSDGGQGDLCLELRRVIRAFLGHKNSENKVDY